MASPIGTVLNTGELVEMILLQAKNRDVLRAQRINKFIKGTIEGSTKLQEKLCFRTTTSLVGIRTKIYRGRTYAEDGPAFTSPVHRNPLLLRKWKYLNVPSNTAATADLTKAVTRTKHISENTRGGRLELKVEEKLGPRITFHFSRDLPEGQELETEVVLWVRAPLDRMYFTSQAFPGTVELVWHPKRAENEGDDEPGASIREQEMGASVKVDALPIGQMLKIMRSFVTNAPKIQKWREVMHGLSVAELSKEEVPDDVQALMRSDVEYTFSS